MRVAVLTIDGQPNLSCTFRQAVSIPNPSSLTSFSLKLSTVNVNKVIDTSAFARWRAATRGDWLWSIGDDQWHIDLPPPQSNWRRRPSWRRQLRQVTWPVRCPPGRGGVTWHYTVPLSCKTVIQSDVWAGYTAGYTSIRLRLRFLHFTSS